MVLRVVGYLALDDGAFKTTLLGTPGFLERLGVCVGSGHPDVAQWALVILHDVAMLGMGACARVLRSRTCVPAMVDATRKTLASDNLKIARCVATCCPMVLWVDVVAAVGGSIRASFHSIADAVPSALTGMETPAYENNSVRHLPS